MKTTAFFRKTALLLLLVAVLMNRGQAQQEGRRTLLSTDSHFTGWFVGFSNSVTRIQDRDVNFPSFSTGIVLNHQFKMGLAVKSLSWYESQLKYDDVLDEKCYLNGGYAGLYLEVTPMADKVIHASFPLVIGGGGATYLSARKYREVEDDGDVCYHRKSLSETPFFVIEPGVNLEMNITDYLSIFAGYSYRWMSGVDLENTPDDALDGSNFNIGLKVGRL